MVRKGSGVQFPATAPYSVNQPMPSALVFISIPDRCLVSIGTEQEIETCGPSSPTLGGYQIEAISGDDKVESFQSGEVIAKRLVY